uniref:BED-type domain-containing protein n=1 Tax=Chenopodium quinoa TaxID=63459 RepID=A0A803N6R2_CHEQI
MLDCFQVPSRSGESATATPSSVNPSSDDPLKSTANASQPKQQDVPPDSEAQIPTERPPDDLRAPKKGKNKISWVWDHFLLFTRDGDKRAKCNYCETNVCGDSKSGTTVMQNHLKRCKEYPPNIDKSQRLLSLQSEQTEQVKGDGSVDENMPGTFVNGRKGRLDLWKFKQDECRKAFAKMVIIDEKPFRCCEHEGFRYFMSFAQPNFVFPSRFTVARDCYRIYVEEKKKLKSYFSKSSSRICLTTDTWTSCQNLSYMCLTAHFIDDNWILHKKILNFCLISSHSGEAIGIQYIRRRLQRWKDGAVLGGKFVHMRCASHILNLTMREGLKENDESIKRIRNGVRFVRSSPARLQKFKNCVNQEQIESKRHLCLDVETRWNSTYLMLEYASIYRKAFDLLETSDGGKFNEELTKSNGVSTDDDWDRVASLLPFLKIFYDATLRLSGSLYVTSNVYLQELVTIGKMIKRKCESSDLGERLMAHGMKRKHDKYWENVNNINLMLYVAVVLDPRRKMQYVKWAIDDQYDLDKGKELYDKIKDALNSLYEHYASQQTQSGSSPSNMVDLTTTDLERFEDWHDMAEFEFERDIGSQSNLEKKSDLDKYLNDEREPNTIGKSFDALDWWKNRGERYPIVALMAKDVLAIPVSTVASESSFSTGGRVLDPFRSSLSSNMVEALICAQDWLRNTRGPLVVEENLEDIERIEEVCLLLFFIAVRCCVDVLMVLCCCTDIAVADLLFCCSVVAAPLLACCCPGYASSFATNSVFQGKGKAPAIRNQYEMWKRPGQGTQKVNMTDHGEIPERRVQAA